MKKVLLSMFLVLSLSAIANAFWVNPQISVSQTLVRVQVVNTWGMPIFCTGEARAYTFYGQFVSGYMNRALIYPGNFSFIDVYTNQFNPFVNASANIFCDFY